MSAEPPRQDRDRDAQGRPRNARPRDALGRPLRYDAAGARPGVAGEPASLPGTPADSPADSLRQAQLLLDAGRPFEAHEVLEDAWKAAPAVERELWRGLAQLAVGLTHAARGNRTGALALIERGAGNIAGYRDRPPHGVDVAGLLAWAATATAAVSAEPSAGPGPEPSAEPSAGPGPEPSAEPRVEPAPAGLRPPRLTLS